MSLFSGITAFVSYMGPFASRGPSRPFSLEPSVDAKHDFACSLGAPCPPFVESSPEDVQCANCHHQEGTFHKCEDWVFVPDKKQEEPCNCCAYIEGMPNVCLRMRIDSEPEPTPEPEQKFCLCCAYIEGMPNVCAKNRSYELDSSDSDSE